MSFEDLAEFALRPAPIDVTIRCTITRDRRGMAKGLYPTYCLHMEREDGKRVSTSEVETTPCLQVFMYSI